MPNRDGTGPLGSGPGMGRGRGGCVAGLARGARMGGQRGRGFGRQGVFGQDAIAPGQDRIAELEKEIASLKARLDADKRQ